MKNNMKKLVPTFEEFIFEQQLSTESKIKTFISNYEVQSFNDANSTDEKLPMQYHRQLKKLGINAEDALVTFGPQTEDWSSFIKDLKKTGVKFIEFKDDETNEPAVIFSKNK